MPACLIPLRAGPLAFHSTHSPPVFSFSPGRLVQEPSSLMNQRSNLLSARVMDSALHPLSRPSLVCLCSSLPFQHPHAALGHGVGVYGSLTVWSQLAALLRPPGPPQLHWGKMRIAPALTGALRLQEHTEGELFSFLVYSGCSVLALGLQQAGRGQDWSWSCRQPLEFPCPTCLVRVWLHCVPR